MNKIDQLEISSRCFLKIGISDNDLNNNIVYPNSIDNTMIRDKKTDYRLEWINKASLKISKKVEITATFNYTHINAPRRKFYLIEDTPELFVAANRFSNFNMGITYKI